MTSRTQFMVVAAAAALLAGAPVAEAKTFKYAFQGDAGTMDPHGLFETPTIAFLSNIYETLVLRMAILRLFPAWLKSGNKPNLIHGALTFVRASSSTTAILSQPMTLCSQSRV
jgi:peptide/nickel transport system substrate-binding protein